MKTNQSQRILEYMQRYGTITDKDARDDLGVQRLGARIYDLKKMGYEITSKWIAVKNRYGETVHIKQYTLLETANENHYAGY